jgi:ribose transport system substrate-binding protein
MIPPKRITSLLLGASLCALSLAPAYAQLAGKKISIAVIPKGTTHIYWKGVEAGARQAAKALGIEMSWKGPLKEDDRAQQIQIVEQYVSEGKSGIILAPLDDTALKRPVDAAMAKHIPVVIIDSALKGEPGKDFISYVSTDNRAAGQMGGDELARVLGGKGKVILLRYQEGSASTTEREEGFLDAMKKYPDLQVISSNRYGGATAAESQNTAMNMIDKIRQANGIFCPGEPVAFGMLLALRQTGLAGKIKFVGFDTAPSLIDAIKKGEIQAVVAQHPKKMASEAVKILVNYLHGEKVPERVDSGAELITAENLNTPEVQALLAAPTP